MATIKIRATWQPKPRVTNQLTVVWDDHYGLNNRSDYKFGVEVNDILLTGQEAYDKLMEPIWTPDGGNFTELLPVFIGLVPRIQNPDFEPGSGLPQYIDNPEYPAQLEALAAAKQQMLDIMHQRLKLLCKVTFPAVPDTGTGIKWEEKQGFWWRQIPVELYKYPGYNRYVTVDEPGHIMYATYLNYMEALHYDKVAMLKRLTGIGG